MLYLPIYKGIDRYSNSLMYKLMILVFTLIVNKYY
ncbi:hypothetical protein CNEO4_840076 [Clostridium neonatale]|nr:hypothetical protein CNEO4_840076 [Clostridium neonatale]